MPFDIKRVNGPETTFSYRQFVKHKLNEDGIGKSAKVKNQRKLAAQLNVISKAKGSCYFENGNTKKTKVICGVFEPREISRSTKYADKGQLFCDFKYAPFSRENRKSAGENEEKLMSNSIRNALESVVCLHEFPNYQIDMFIMVLEDDGSVLSTSIMASGLAFIDASIPCFDIIASSSASIIEGNIFIEPRGNEEITSLTNASDGNGTVSISSLDSIEQISQVTFNGRVDAKLLMDVKKQLIEINKERVKYLKKIISMKIVEDQKVN